MRGKDSSHKRLRGDWAFLHSSLVTDPAWRFLHRAALGYRRSGGIYYVHLHGQGPSRPWEQEWASDWFEPTVTAKQRARNFDNRHWETITVPAYYPPKRSSSKMLLTTSASGIWCRVEWYILPKSAGGKE